MKRRGSGARHNGYTDPKRKVKSPRMSVVRIKKYGEKVHNSLDAKFGFTPMLKRNAWENH